MTPEEWQETLVMSDEEEDPYLERPFDEEEDFTPYRKYDRRRRKERDKERALNRRKARAAKERNNIPTLWEDDS